MLDIFNQRKVTPVQQSNSTKQIPHRFTTPGSDAATNMVSGALMAMPAGAYVADKFVRQAKI